MNQIMIIEPYWKYGTWCFTDDSVGLKDEPFVAGIPELINAGIKQTDLNLRKCEKGFRIIFSKDEFPEYTIRLELLEDDTITSGGWYKSIINGTGYTGWLCPALFKYFEDLPQEIYAKFEYLT